MFYFLSPMFRKKWWSIADGVLSRQSFHPWSSCACNLSGVLLVNFAIQTAVAFDVEGSFFLRIALLGKVKVLKALQPVKMFDMSVTGIRLVKVSTPWDQES